MHAYIYIYIYFLYGKFALLWGDIFQVFCGFFSLPIKVKYLYIRIYTTAMDFCGNCPAAALNREKNTNDVTDGKGERGSEQEREREIDR